jgi:hypothetical protein
MLAQLAHLRHPCRRPGCVVCQCWPHAQRHRRAALRPTGALGPRGLNRLVWFPPAARSNRAFGLPHTLSDILHRGRWVALLVALLRLRRVQRQRAMPNVRGLQVLSTPLVADAEPHAHARADAARRAGEVSSARIRSLPEETEGGSLGPGRRLVPGRCSRGSIRPVARVRPT